jgi:hypothetical protein
MLCVVISLLSKILCASVGAPERLRVYRLMGTSGTMDRFAAELEGALHVKEQEKIIAEVRQPCPSDGFVPQGVHSCPSLSDLCPRCQQDSRQRPFKKRKRICAAFDLARSCPLASLQCEEQCKAILEIVDSDVVSVPTEHFTGIAILHLFFGKRSLLFSMAEWGTF